MAIEVYNIMEDLVHNELISIVDKMPRLCRCEQCIADVTAMALNNLKPRYVSTDKGGVLARIMSTSETEQINLIREVTAAAEKVANNPRHAPMPDVKNKHHLTIERVEIQG